VSENDVETRVGWEDGEDAWGKLPFTSFGTGVGRGLSRGLTSKVSDATIRRRSGLGRTETL